MRHDQAIARPASDVANDASAKTWSVGGLVVICIWLGWQIIQTPLLERGPASFAIRVSPWSPEVIRRAAEQELLANRHENAAALARESLRRAPFNARALRVVGIAESRAGNDVLADQLLTTAGNWSLRDDPAHAWLTEYRLRNADYRSAFAHADTLARRRVDLHTQLFNLFTTAAATDPRAIPPLIQAVGENPSWRTAYLISLYEREDGDSVLFALAAGLQRTSAPLDNDELGRLYQTWRFQRRIPAIRQLRNTLNRPPASLRLIDGDFSATLPPLLPLGWELRREAGVEVEITRDDLDPGNTALRVLQSGEDPAMLAEQMVILPAGAYSLEGRWRVERPEGGRRVSWSMSCFEGGEPIAQMMFPPANTPPNHRWQAFRLSIEIPERNCSAQWLRLDGTGGKQGQSLGMWFDDLALEPST